MMNMKDNLDNRKDMEEVNIVMPIEMCTKDFGKMISKMIKTVYSSFIQVHVIKDKSRTDDIMALAN